MSKGGGPQVMAYNGVKQLHDNGRCKCDAVGVRRKVVREPCPEGSA